VNGHIHAARDFADIRDKWVAIRLSDGGSDGVLYDTKRDAVSHQLDEFQCAYISFRNIVAGMAPYEAELFLNFVRRAYDAGFRLPDPDAQTGGGDLFLSTQGYDNLRRLHVSEFQVSGAVLLDAYRHFHGKS